MTRVKTDIEPGLYETTYTTRNKDGQESVVRVIEYQTLEILDIPCDTIVKQEPTGEPLDSELNTLLTQDLHEELENTLVKQEAVEIEDIKTENDFDDCSNSEYVYNIKDEPLDSELDIVGNQELYDSNKIENIRTEHDYADCSNSEYSSNSERLAHEGIRYPCNKCPKTFSLKGNLNRHLLTHDGIRYPCSECPKSFSYKCDLNKHLLTHEGTKYPCNKCSKSFSQKGDLNIHLLTHEGITYTCDKCTKSFSQKRNLKRHLFTHESHNGIRYHCDKCPKAFSQEGNLKQHLLTCHQIIKFSCARGSKSLTRKVNLKKLRYDNEGHFPEWVFKRGRCQECKNRKTGFSFAKCCKCGVYLCLKLYSDCFYNYHHEVKK